MIVGEVVRITVHADAGWFSAAVGAGAALLGALVGTGGLLYIQARNERRGKKDDHIKRLATFVSAVHIFVAFIEGYPNDQARPTIMGVAVRRRELWRHEGRLLERLWGISDDLWRASADIRPVATVEEWKAVSDVLSTAVRWQLGQPLPTELLPALARLSALLGNPKSAHG